MTVIRIGAPAVESAAGSWSAIIDYDDVAQTVAITPTGTGHAILSLFDNTVTPARLLGRVNCDQFGNDGQRHIVAGPGATGLQTDGSALPTQRVSGAIVGQLNAPKGVKPSLAIGLDWTAS